MALASDIKAASDLCVACGLCLPHCPTYQDSLNENESPRGRIALLRALADDRLPASATLKGHIDRCLGCLACAAVCPSHVPYGTLLQSGRALLVQKRRADLSVRLYRILIQATRSVRAVGLLYRLARLAQTLQLLPLLGKRLRLALQDLPRRPRPALLTPMPATAPEVALFCGCTADIDRETLNAAIRVLQACGKRVSLPQTQGCCGALARHAGFADIGRDQERRNRRAFTANPLPVVTVASGCTATLRDYDKGGVSGFPPVYDIHQYLKEQGALHDVAWVPLHQTIVVHEPCSLRHDLKGARALYDLLAHIPGARIVAAPDNSVCCGAAGDYFMREPQEACALADRKIEAIRALEPDLIVSANIGCALHLSAALSRHGHTIPVVHPLLVLAGQLPLDARHDKVRV